MLSNGRSPVISGIIAVRRVGFELLDGLEFLDGISEPENRGCVFKRKLKRYRKGILSRSEKEFINLVQ